MAVPPPPLGVLWGGLDLELGFEPKSIGDAKSTIWYWFQCNRVYVRNAAAVPQAHIVLCLTADVGKLLQKKKIE